MIKFLLKGLARDRSRSLFPVLVVAAGVVLTVLMHGWVGGVLVDIIQMNAKFSTGHVKVMSRAYAENEDQVPNDLALVGIQDLVADLEKKYPELIWVSRIRFGGLVDIPDSAGETRAQGPAMGLAVDLFSANSPEAKMLNIQKSVVRGRLPSQAGEILLSDVFARKLAVAPGDKATLISSTMFGSMAMQNFTIVGTLNFGVAPMDKGMLIIDLKDAQSILDMQDSAGEILGFFPDQLYHEHRSAEIVASFNAGFADDPDEFAPVMQALRDQAGLGDYLDMATSFSGILVFVFLAAMSLVLWNTGLIGGLRRYGEVGLRLAIGENKSQVYRSMVLESVLVGVFGSIIGTVIGFAIVYYIQVHGINIGALMKNNALMISDVVRTRITPLTYYIGFVPGLLSTVLGTMLAGIGIYKRNTAQLFKELEA